MITSSLTFLGSLRSAAALFTKITEIPIGPITIQVWAFSSLHSSGYNILKSLKAAGDGIFSLS